MTRSRLLMLALSLGAVVILATACATATPTPTPTTAAGGAETSGGGAEKAYLTPGDLGSLASFAAAASGSQQAGIWVTGQGSVSLEPDLVVLTLGVEVKEDTVQQAMGRAAEAMTAVVAALKARGIEDKDIRTTRFSIQPQYHYPRDGEPVLTGYRVTNQVSVKVRDLDSVGVVIDEVAAAGGDYTRINGISFTVEDDSDARVDARELAVKDALAKAEQLAQLTGVTVGKLIYISESTSGVYPRDAFKGVYALEEAVPSAVPTPISGGEMDVTVNVQAVFGIE